jgi:hypothetical protein
MTSDLDIYRSANLLVKRHGEDAPIEAAMRADAMLEAGDLDGYAVWKRIVKAVGDRSRLGRRPGRWGRGAKCENAAQTPIPHWTRTPLWAT